MPETVLVEDRGPVRLLTLNRPDKLNAFNGALIRDLGRALSDADAADGIAAIVLTGAGRAFSAGADMKEAESHRDRSHRATVRAAGASTSLVEALGAIDKVVIAAVNGYALGAGAAIAISCDLVVAGESAVFGYPEVKRGLAATAVAPSLVAQIGRKHAAELLLLCPNVSAARAVEIGLANRVAPDAAVVDAALEMAATLCGYDNDALWATKRMIRRSADLTLAQAHGLARDNMLVMRGFDGEKTQ